MARQRVKCCGICGKEAAVMYRCRHQHDGQWDLICRDCWNRVSQDNPAYQYGGTWKATKR
ncbi:hypothetical protein IQ266_02630 [filamentous cyanobacterium LEGE 11480]|uniref:Uncharacterized protein n=1 Tax=Romeriopsis navalis LEGE 11480 TaxID=2777977 RepID=A0A928Z2Z4_9CYAN|nr:hypothetical protein [Romeriopsis navalis]MBE9028653.1 hypothetical protein [Romeriopsis navalis LEGE 11480]